MHSFFLSSFTVPPKFLYGGVSVRGVCQGFTLYLSVRGEDARPPDRLGFCASHIDQKNKKRLKQPPSRARPPFFFLAPNDGEKKGRRRKNEHARTQQRSATEKKNTKKKYEKNLLKIFQLYSRSRRVQPGPSSVALLPSTFLCGVILFER